MEPWLELLPRFLLEGLVLVYCFRVIYRGGEPSDKAAAWAIVGLIVASVIRNLTGT